MSDDQYEIVVANRADGEWDAYLLDTTTQTLVPGSTHIAATREGAVNAARSFAGWYLNERREERVAL